MPTTYSGHVEAYRDQVPRFVARWLFSTNHKDIGTLYLGFATCAGLVGGALSMLMRLELLRPGLQYFSDGQQWNAVISAHGLS